MFKNREKEIFKQNYILYSRKADHLFATLFIFQLILAVVLAVWFTPKTWIGQDSQVHWHIYLAVYIATITALYPIYLGFLKAGKYSNRFVMAAAQMIYSILLIHITGGRIETHFHIFGSLAFLSFYRDYRPILFATTITIIDHFLRGAYWPLSMYGTILASSWRAFEYAAWVIFEDVFLLIAIRSGLDDIQFLSKNQAELELTLTKVETLAAERFHELERTQQVVQEQKNALIQSAKMSALGEMAGGIAHEINTPLAVIQLRSDQLMECVEENNFDKELIANSINGINETIQRIGKIVQSLRSFSRDGKTDKPILCSVNKVVTDTFAICK